MAPQPFTGFYSAALRDLCASVDPKDVILFMYVASYANEYGICYPGVRKMAEDLQWRHEEVRYRLDRLERQHLIKYLRRGARDPITSQFTPDVYQMNLRLYFGKERGLLGDNEPVTHAPSDAEQEPVTHASEDSETGQLRMPPSNLQHNQNQNQIYQPESRTRIRNQHQQPDEVSSEGVKGASYAWAENTQTEDEKAKGKNPNTNTNANTPQANPAPAGTKTAPAGHAEGNTPPSSAPPPIASGWEPATRYVNALPDARLEALANELRAVAPTRLYNARELVMAYGEVQVRAGLAQLSNAMAKGNVYNPYGLLSSWLRKGVLKAEPVVESDTAKYTTGQYAGYIES